MNKMITIYNVVKKMKDKNSMEGTFKAEGLKDKEKVLVINNVFQRNTKDGQTKGKTCVEVDCEGKKMKLENSIDFQMEGCESHKEFMKHMHSFHNHNHGEHAGGIKEGLGKIAAVFGLLSAINIEEKEDGSAVLSLNSADIPEEIRKEMHEKMSHRGEHQNHMEGNHPQHMFMKEFHNMEDVNFTLNVFINKDNDITKAAIDLKGQQKAEGHVMALNGELCLV